MKKRGRAEEASGWTMDKDGAVASGPPPPGFGKPGSPICKQGDGFLASPKSGQAD